MNFVVNDNSWKFKFYNFSYFQNVISNTLPSVPPQLFSTHEGHYDTLRTKIDMGCTPNSQFKLMAGLVKSWMQKQSLEVFYKKPVLKIFATLKRKHWCLCLKKLQAFRTATWLKRLQRMCFPINIAYFSRTPILKNIYERLFQWM